MMKPLKQILLAALCATFASCATIFSGSQQKITINSFPDGATILVGGLHKGTTPGEIRIKRKAPAPTITLVKEGYREHIVRTYSRTNEFVWGNIVSWGVLGLGVDAISGAIYRIDPKEIDVELRPAEDNYKYMGK